MSNEKNLPYAVVCGGVNIDIGAHSFAPLRAKDSNPGKVELSLGGVGRNIAHNMRLLGVPTYLLTAVGGDSRASQVEESCKELGIDLSHALRVPDGRTSTYVFVGDSDGDMAVAVADMEICEKLTPDYFASQKELLDGAAAVVVDANLPRESIAYLVEHCAAPLFVDPVSTVKAEKLQGLLSHVHTLKPNRIEAELLSGVKITDNATLHQAAQALLDQGVQRVFLSLGGDGVCRAAGRDTFGTHLQGRDAQRHRRGRRDDGVPRLVVPRRPQPCRKLRRRHRRRGHRGRERRDHQSEHERRGRSGPRREVNFYDKKEPSDRTVLFLLIFSDSAALRRGDRGFS